MKSGLAKTRELEMIAAPILSNANSVKLSVGESHEVLIHESLVTLPMADRGRQGYV